MIWRLQLKRDLINKILVISSFLFTSTENCFCNCWPRSNKNNNNNNDNIDIDTKDYSSSYFAHFRRSDLAIEAEVCSQVSMLNCVCVYSEIIANRLHSIIAFREDEDKGFDGNRWARVRVSVREKAGFCKRISMESGCKNELSFSYARYALRAQLSIWLWRFRMQTPTQFAPPFKLYKQCKIGKRQNTHNGM